MNRMSYTYSTYIYAYDADTKIRVLINPDGTAIKATVKRAGSFGIYTLKPKSGRWYSIPESAALRKPIAYGAMRSNSCLTRNATIQIFAVGC